MYFFVWCWGYNCGAYKRKFTVYTGAQQLNSMTSSLRGRRSEVKGARKNGRARETREGEGAPAGEAHENRFPLPLRVALAHPVLSCGHLLPSALYAGERRPFVLTKKIN